MVETHHASEAGGCCHICAERLCGDRKQCSRLSRIGAGAVPTDEEPQIFDLPHRKPNLVRANRQTCFHQSIEDLSHLLQVLCEGTRGGDEDVVHKCEGVPKR